MGLNLETKWRQIEHTTIIFMLTVSDLGLSSEASVLCLGYRVVELSRFLERQQKRMEKSKSGPFTPIKCLLALK